MTDVLLTNAALLDPTAGALLADRHVLVRGGRIAEVLEGRPPAGVETVLDVRGRTLMPGLCDGHVHVTAATPDFAALERWSPTYVSARAGEILEAMLMRGFTTVRDAGGCDFGIAQAVEEGYLEGPRILFCGHALSQTGGHADMRARGQNAFESCFCCSGLGRIVDGVDAMRQACRDEIRKGATHIKLMVSGGVASPTDRITNTQFSLDEITAAVEEAEAADVYVMAHAYTPRAIARAVRCGVRSIEHGNLIDAETVALMTERGTFLVPTLSTYDALAREGLQAGLPADIHGKVFEVLDAGQKALEIAHRGGVELVYGTDLLGSMHHLWTPPALQERFQRDGVRSRLLPSIRPTGAALELLALMRSADRHPINIANSAVRWCRRVWPIPVRPMLPSRRPSPSQPKGSWVSR